MRPKAEVFAELRQMLRDVFSARNEGANYAKLSRAHGYVDGYMRALLESGAATKEELLSLVTQARASVDGPALREVVVDSESAAA